MSKIVVSEVFSVDHGTTLASIKTRAEELIALFGNAEVTVADGLFTVTRYSEIEETAPDAAPVQQASPSEQEEVS